MTNGYQTPVPLPMDSWQKEINEVPRPSPGCYTASYPALEWHAVKCSTVTPGPD